MMIQLKPFTRDDFQRLIEWLDSPTLLLQWGGPEFSYPLDESQLEKYVEKSKEKPPRRMIFKAIDTTAEGVVGHVDLDNIDRKTHSARVGRVLVGPAELRGKGIGAEIMKAILRRGFEELDLHRIELRVWQINKQAIACYEKIGFAKEGLLRDARKINSKYYNVYIMSMLETEWEQYKNQEKIK